MRNATRLTVCSLVLITGLAATPCTAQAIAGGSATDSAGANQANAAASRTQPARVRSDPFTYARLGYGGIAGDRLYGAPAVGFGIRGEVNSLGIDVSFFNVQYTSPSSGWSGASSMSFVKLEVLRFSNSDRDAAGYFGGGFGWGGTSISSAGRDGGYTSGGGIEGDLTAGYELGRTTTIRFFAQADATMPFYASSSYTYSPQGSVNTTTHRYVPSMVVSLGLGWQHDWH